MKRFELALGLVLSVASSSSAHAAAAYNRLPASISVCAGFGGTQCDTVSASGRVGGISHDTNNDLDVCAGTDGCSEANRLCPMGSVGLAGGDVLTVTLKDTTVSCNAYHAGAINNGRITGSAYASASAPFKKSGGRWVLNGDSLSSLLQTFIEQLGEAFEGGGE
jgi:hypothetical protein